MKLRLLLPAGAVVAILLGACAKPLPPDKATYAGLWQSADMSLDIGADGSVDYTRKNGNSSTSVKGPIKEFAGDNFSVGLGPLSTTFVVTAPPHEEDGAWHMTVDGVDLTKQ